MNRYKPARPRLNVERQWSAAKCAFVLVLCSLALCAGVLWLLSGTGLR